MSQIYSTFSGGTTVNGNQLNSQFGTDWGQLYEPYVSGYGSKDPDLGPDQGERLKKIIEGSRYKNKTSYQLLSSGIPEPQNYLAYKPKKDTVEKFLTELEDIKFFRGGNDEQYEKIEKLAQDWLDLAIADKHIQNGLPIERVNRKYIGTNYGQMTKIWQYRRANNFYSNNNIKVDAYQVVKDAMIDEEKELDVSLALIEYRILKAGGMLVGTFEGKLIVCFDSIAELVMDQLMADADANQEETLQTVSGHKWSQYNGSVMGGGGGGSGGLIIAPSAFVPQGIGYFSTTAGISGI